MEYVGINLNATVESLQGKFFFVHVFQHKEGKYLGQVWGFLGDNDKGHNFLSSLSFGSKISGILISSIQYRLFAKSF